MPSTAFYRTGAERVLTKQVDFVADTIKAILLKNTYTKNLTTDEFLSAVSAHRMDTDVTLTGKSAALGVFDCDDIEWAAVAAGDTASCVALYIDTGNPATSPMLLWTDNIAGFPLGANGGNIKVQIDNGAFKFFSL